MVVILLTRSPVGCSGVDLARETLVPETIMTAADVRKRCLEIVGFASWFCVLNGALLEYLPSELEHWSGCLHPPLVAFIGIKQDQNRYPN